MHAFRSRFVAAGVAISTIAAAAAITTAIPAFATPTDTSQSFAATGAVQTWTVPNGVTQIYVDLAGAQGGASFGGGGGGGELTGTLTVTPGQTLNIIAGGAGGNGVRYGIGAGGGGGSFIYTTANQSGILAAAGGGGGAGSNVPPASAASTGTSGTSGGNGGGAGGSAGNGGGAGTAGGGGGLLSNGGSNSGGGGLSVANGAGGGSGSGGRGAGGFGGGGGTTSFAGGAGGGYSGGGGGRYTTNNGGGGGGGSYFAGTRTGAVANHGGNGFVTIYYPSLLTSLSPASGLAGDSLTIDGSGLTGATVTIGAVTATVTSSSDTQLVATIPAQSPVPAGAQTVHVATAGGVTLPAVGAFTYVPGPTVTAVSPSSTETGSAPTMTITGTHFTAATAVNFGTTPATSFTVNSDTSITATVPSSLAAGTVDTTVVTPDGTSPTSTADQLTVANATITLSPSMLSNAQEGVAYSSQITASGGTSPYTYSIVSGALPAGITLSAATGALTGTPTTQGTFSFTVQAADTYGDTGSANYSINTLPPTPTITSISPVSGATSGGTNLTITGTDFTGTTAVTIGSTPVASFTVVSPTTITAVTAASSAGNFTVTVTTPGGTSPASANAHFTYVVAPTVAAVTPANGAGTGGTSVTITGTGFTGASAVHFGTFAARFTVNSDTSITAIAPTSATGGVDITVTTAGGVSSTSAADRFTFDPPVIVTTVDQVAQTGADVGMPLSIAGGLLLAGLIAGAFVLIASRRREAR